MKAGVKSFGVGKIGQLSHKLPFTASSVAPRCRTTSNEIRRKELGLKLN